MEKQKKTAKKSKFENIYNLKDTNNYYGLLIFYIQTNIKKNYTSFYQFYFVYSNKGIINKYSKQQVDIKFN